VTESPLDLVFMLVHCLTLHPYCPP